MSRKQIQVGCVAALLLFMGLSCPATAGVDEPVAEAGGVTAALPRESRFLAVSDGEPAAAWLHVRNRGNEIRKVRLEVLLRSPDERETPHDYQVELSPGGDERVFLPRKRLDLNGIYTVRFRPEKMSYASALGAKAYTWYNLMDRAGGEQSNRPGHTYGLLTNPTGTGNFAEIEDRIRPKEALVAAAAAAAVRELRGRPHLETWAQDGRRFAFLFGESLS